MIISAKLKKTIAISFSILILTEAKFPFKSFALTSGPNSPEFSTFTPVNSNDLVDVFTGTFNYNLPILSVPGPAGSGYGLSLAYNSNINSEMEASWVGFGWTLNPGSIMRNTNGFPDDYQGVNIKYYNKTIPNITMTAKEDIALEFFGKDSNGKYKKNLFNVSLGKTMRYNNYNGISRIWGFGLGAKGVGIGLTYDGNNATFNGSINPFATIMSLQEDNSKAEEQRTNKTWSEALKESGKETVKKIGMNALYSMYDIHTHQSVINPQILKPSNGTIYNWSGSLEINSAVPVGPELGFSVSLSTTKTDETFIYPTYGYLYPNPSDHNSNDYIVEKGAPFTKRTVNLGLPFSCPDQFIVTAEGLGGGFRTFHNSERIFHPTYPGTYNQEIGIVSIGVEAAVGPNLGLGMDVGLGKQKTTAESWEINTNPNQNLNNGSFFNFNSDQAGMVDYSVGEFSTTDPESGVLTSSSTNAFSINYEPKYQVHSILEDWKGSSSYIEHSLSDNEANLSKYPSDFKFIPENKSLIDQFKITNNDGKKYVYGLAVYNRNEVNLQVDVDAEQIINGQSTKTNLNNVRNNYLVTKPIHESDIFSIETEDDFLNSNAVVIGDQRTTEYASSFLLTEITSPDYIDTDENGPSDLDYGGWTKFSYKNKYSFDESGSGYHWRMPYSGLLYHKNEISNLVDDMGSLSMGDKEIYYLKAIETKTHVAFFITNNTSQLQDFHEYFNNGTTPPSNYLDGSGKIRYDGLEASQDASESLNAKGSKKTDMLERIVLYSKSDFSKPLQTIYLEYDNSLVKNLPNSVATNPAQSGKLTLKRVWTETEGVIKSKISPYVFNYEYFTEYPQEISDKYPLIADFAKNLPEAVQNPCYSPYEVSVWGNQQYDGANRYQKMQDWLYQGNIPLNKHDPAAWQLKSIKLPSGGEIHIQYEENDYCFVQDRRAMALISLLNNKHSYDTPEYVINLKDIGLDEATSLQEKNDYIEQLKAYFFKSSSTSSDDEKVYFKFLSKLKGTSPSVNDVKSEYISGYASVKNIYLYNGQICFEFEHLNERDNIYTPRQICYDFVLNRRGGRLDKSNNILKYDELLNKKDITKGNYIEAFLRFVGEFYIFGGLGPNFQWPNKSLIGENFNGSLSYLKLPLPNSVKQPECGNYIMKAKRGGGSRVKRLLMYDSGIENGTAVLYGSEYKYELDDKSSSGVATNEPPASREENALVTFLRQEKQEWISKLISGPDKNQYEGPLGENILPSASIGYSRIVVENINKTNSTTGFSITEYYTVKDYPFDKDYSTEDINGAGVKYTSLGDKVSYNKSNQSHINLGLFSSEVDKSWASQGFRFIINEMNGKIKSLKNYRGTYSIETLNTNLISSQEYEYFEPGESIRVWNGHSIFESYPGKQVDITTESGTINDESTDLNLEFDVSVTCAVIPIVFITLIPQYHYKNVQFNSFASTKVVRYPTILKKVRNFNEGNSTEIEYLVFDYNTGKALQTRTTDGFDNLYLANNTTPHNGSIYNLSIPACFIYSNLGPMYKLPRVPIYPASSNQLNDIAGQFTTYGSDPLLLANAVSDIKLYNLLGAQTTTYKNGYYSTGFIEDDYAVNETILGKLQPMWKPHKIYSHKIVNTKSSNNNGKIYEAGYIEGPVDMFNWGLPQDNWINSTEIIEFSPNGEPLEERDIQNIYSTVKYGGSESKSRNQPSIIAHNAKYSQVFFRDFENELIHNKNVSHTGKNSYALKYGESLKLLTLPLKAVDEYLLKQGAYIKMWVHCPTKNEPNLVAYNGIKTVSFQKEAQSGDWSLYRAKFDNTMFSITTDTEIWIKCYGYETMIDDVVFHPTQSEVTSYVYDLQSQRLIAKFGSSHFGLMYGYNSEGKLVRTMVETEKGIKTIQETQYNTRTENRIQ